MEVTEKSLYKLYDDMDTDELHDLYRNRKKTLTDTALGILERVLSEKGVTTEESEKLDEQMRDSNYDSNDASKKSFGHIPTVGAILLFGVIGLFKHADNIVRPILKGGDDAASVFVRNSDEFARYSGNGNDSSVYTSIHPYLVVKGAQAAVRGAQSAAKDDDKPVISIQRDSMVEAQHFPQITMSISDLKGTYTENTYTKTNDIGPDIFHRNDATAVRE